ncbi:MAG: asparagine synthase-related protein [Erythrobacter sp.]
MIAALAPYAAPDVAGQWSDQSALIAQALHHNTPSSLAERTPEICLETGRIIASWVRLDNRDELCGMLGMRDHLSLSDPQIILAAHRQWGGDCAGKLEGDFSFVIHDPARQEAFCARDAIGVKPLFYTQTDTHFILSTSVAAIKRVDGIQFAPNRKWIALFASGFSLADEETAYSGVQRLAPGHHLTIRQGKAGQPRGYHAFNLSAPHSTQRNPMWVERYSSAFDRAVDVRSRSQFLVGAESSGGLDSASILARLVEVVPHNRDHLHTHSLVAHQREIDLLDELNSQLGLSQTHSDIRPATLRVDESVERAITAIGHPPEHGQPLLSADFFSNAQTLGIRTVLSGFGGDEIATSYAKHLVDELHHRREWRAVFGEIEGGPLRRSLRFARRIVEGPNDPHAGMHAQLSAKLAGSFVSREFLEDSGLRKQIEDWMLPDIGECTLNRIAALSPGFHRGRTGRLEASALFAATYGIEYRFPFYDRRLIQQFLDTPSIEKRRGSMGRYLHRRALSNRVPDGIVWQPTKDMGPALGGEFCFASYPPLHFNNLPPVLKEISNRKAFEDAQSLVTDPPNPMDPAVMRARHLMWHTRQLCLWLKE